MPRVNTSVGVAADVTTQRFVPCPSGSLRLDTGPIPVLLLRYGPVPPASFSALTHDPRFEMYGARDITPEWASFSQCVAGTFVVTERDPISALVYALTGGIRSGVVVIVANATKIDIEDALTAGARACLTLPLSAGDIDRLVRDLETVLASHEWTPHCGCSWTPSAARRDIMTSLFP